MGNFVYHCIDLRLDDTYTPANQKIEDAYLRTIVAHLKPSGARGDIILESAKWPVYA